MCNEEKSDETINCNDRRNDKPETLSSRRGLQQHKSGSINNTGKRRYRKSEGNSRKRGRRPNSQKITNSNKEISKNKQTEKILTKYKITLQQIRDKLSNQQLRNLLVNKFDSNEFIEIEYNIKPNTFIEDIFRNEIIPKKNKPKLVLYPSVEYGKYYDEWKNGKEANEYAIFGCYLVHYKNLFEEEDPEWVRKSCKSALLTIKKLVVDLNKGDYEDTIKYIETIMPLWAKRLYNNEKFPSYRPNIKFLFNNSHFWADRYITINRWKS